MRADKLRQIVVDTEEIDINDVPGYIKRKAVQYGVTVRAIYKHIQKEGRQYLRCPRCGTMRNVKRQGYDYVCMTPTPDDPQGFKRCWYHFNIAEIAVKVMVNRQLSLFDAAE